MLQGGGRSSSGGRNPYSVYGSLLPDKEKKPSWKGLSDGFGGQHTVWDRGSD